MIKKLGIILSAAALTFTLACCSEEPTEGYKRAESDTCDFHFDIPYDWEVTYTDGMIAATKMKDVSKATVVGFSFNDTLEEAEDQSSQTENAETNESFEYWQNNYKPMLETTYGTLSNVTEEAAVLKGANVANVSYTATIGEEKFNCDTMLLYLDGTVYTMTLTQGAENDNNKEYYTDYSEEFSKIVDTFDID